MKADHSGTTTEQKRARQGWIGPNTRPTCKSCRHVEMICEDRAAGCEKIRYRCTIGNFATLAGASCDEVSA